MLRFFCIGLAILQLTACSIFPDKIAGEFKLDKGNELYRNKSWTFWGRIAITDQKNALSADIVWAHDLNQESIELAGIFGMGRTKINLSRQRVMIDSAGKEEVSYGDVNDIVSSKLGVTVPVAALQYWVLGLVAPSESYIRQESGFEQYGWRVRYQQMQQQSNKSLPRKIRLEKGGSLLKLIINQWKI